MLDLDIELVYKITCGYCGRVDHSDASSEELASEEFTSNGWTLENRDNCLYTTCRSCAD